MNESGQCDQRQRVVSLLERYETRLVRYAARMLGEEDSARRGSARFFAVVRATGRAAEGRTAQWLFTVCRNRAIDVLRKRKRTTQFEQGGGSEIEPRAESRLGGRTPRPLHAAQSHRRLAPTRPARTGRSLGRGFQLSRNIRHYRRRRRQTEGLGASGDQASAERSGHAGIARWASGRGRVSSDFARRQGAIMNERDHQAFNGQFDEALLTAYALGELEGTELALVEAALKTSPDACRAVDEIRVLAGYIREAAGHDERFAPSATLRGQIESRLDQFAPRPAAESPDRRGRTGLSRRRPGSFSPWHRSPCWSSRWPFRRCPCSNEVRQPRWRSAAAAQSGRAARAGNCRRGRRRQSPQRPGAGRDVG